MLERSGRPRLSLKMTQETSVRRFCAAVGGGKVYGPYQNHQGLRDGYRRQDFWFWVAVGEDARLVSERLRPHLSAWRIRAIEAWYSSREKAGVG
jgi:hypothetical protein